MAKNPPLQVLIQDFCQIYKATLCYVLEYDCFYKLNEDAGYFSPLDTHQLKGLLLAYFESYAVDFTVSEGVFSNSIELLRQKTILTLQDINDHESIFADKTVINLNTFATRSYQLGDTIFYHLNCSYLDKPPYHFPVFGKFLNEVLVDNDNQTDSQLLSLVQEMFGYYFMTKIEPPMTFFLVGNGANGKSTLQFVLEQIVGGSAFVTANSIEGMTMNRFDVQDLRFRRLNICSEEQSKYLKSDKFKSIVEGQLIRAEIKHGKLISFRPKTKHIFATNNMPSLDSVDDGVKRRIKIIPFKRTFSAQEADKGLKTTNFKDSKFAPELPAIVAWAIAGAKRLVENNYVFTSSTAIDAEMGEYESNVSSVINFFADNFLPAGNGDADADFYSAARLYSLYMLWCGESAGRKPVSVNNFKRETRQYFHIKEMLVGWDKCDRDHRRGMWLRFSSDSTIKVESKKVDSGGRRKSYVDLMPDQEDTAITFNQPA